MAAEDAVRWKHWVFGLMELWGLKPDDLILAVLMYTSTHDTSPESF